MRSIFLLLTMIVVLATVIGCGDDDASTPDAGATDGSSEASVSDGSPAADGATDSDGAVDAAGVCPEGPCDLIAQTGCSAGSACYFATLEMGGTPAPMCLAIETRGEAGDPCEFLTDCGPGLLCAGRDAEPRVCRPYCCNNGGCPDRLICAVQLSDGSGTRTGVGICLDCGDCDLLAQDCSGESGCYPVGADGCSICTDAGDGSEDAACNAANDCARGLSCIPVGGVSTCRKFCDATQGNTGCGDGQVCVSLGYTREGYEAAGFCREDPRRDE